MPVGVKRPNLCQHLRSYAEAFMGTPAQRFLLCCDTGSADLWCVLPCHPPALCAAFGVPEGRP